MRKTNALPCFVALALLALVLLMQASKSNATDTPSLHAVKNVVVKLPETSQGQDRDLNVMLLEDEKGHQFWLVRNLGTITYQLVPAQ